MKTVIMAVGVLSLFAGQSQAGTIFTYNGSAGLTELGTATSGTALELTSAGTNEAGMAYTTTALTLGPDDSFSTTFEFSLTAGTSVPANGFAFVLSANAPVLGNAGQDLGYAKNGANTDSLAVAFNTYNYGSGDGSSSNNIAIDADGSISYLDLANVYGLKSCTSGEGCMSNGATWSATISYDGANLAVTLQDPAESSTFTFTDAISFATMESYLGTSSNSLYAAFSGGTGDDYQQQDILNWQVSDTAITPEPGSFMLLAAGLLVLGAGLHRNVRPRGK